MIYKLYMTTPDLTQPNAATTVGVNPQTSFLFAPQNPDYANFKREINEGTAQLQDADGNLMTAEQAKDFVKELP